jgi:hypothetical protein
MERRNGRPTAPSRPLDSRAVAGATMPERALQGQIEALARMAGWAVWHDRATNLPRACWHCGRPPRVRRNVRGFPDLVLVKPGRLVVAELKSEAGRLSPDQRAWLALFRAVPGVEVYEWRPADWEQIVAVLTR